MRESCREGADGLEIFQNIRNLLLLLSDVILFQGRGLGDLELLKRVNRSDFYLI